MPADNPQDLTDAVAAVKTDFPTLAPHLDMSVVQYGQSAGPNDDRQLEFYHPSQPDNPNPGKNTLEIYNRDLKGPMLQEAIAGDMLHRLGAVDEKTGQPVDPQWQDLRQQLSASRTSTQKAIDAKAYRTDKQSPVYGNLVGSQQDWDQESRLDAYVRGGVFPKSNPEWQGGYFTPEQEAIFGKMRNYLKAGN